VGYIQELRQILGNRPIIVVGATVVVRDEAGRILLQHRSDTDDWGLPGGAMEPGESAELTASRELYEETNLQADKFRLLDVLSGPEYHFTYPNSDEIHTVIILYEALGVTGDKMPNDDESKRLAYFSLSDLPQLESRAVGVIRHLLEPKHTVE
jgi:8-oxo-dGTP pyrophosphatase MutT (NUDIX family)